MYDKPKCIFAHLCLVYEKDKSILSIRNEEIWVKPPSVLGPDHQKHNIVLALLLLVLKFWSIRISKCTDPVWYSQLDFPVIARTTQFLWPNIELVFISMEDVKINSFKSWYIALRLGIVAGNIEIRIMAWIVWLTSCLDGWQEWTLDASTMSSAVG